MSFLPGLQGWIDSRMRFIPRETAAFCGDLQNMEMLDVGGGDMLGDIGLLQLGIKHITALDVLDREWNVVEHAAREVRNAGYSLPEDYSSRLEFSTYDGIRFPFPDNHFDFVFSWSAFEHIPDVVGVLREVRRVIKPLGRVFVQVDPWYHSFHGSHLSDFIQEPFFHLKRSNDWVKSRLDEFVAAHPDQRDVVFGTMWPEFCHLNGFSARKFLAAVSDAGFSIERLQSTIDFAHLSEAPPEVEQIDVVTSGSMVLLQPRKRLNVAEMAIASLQQKIRNAQVERNQAVAELQAQLEQVRSRQTELQARLESEHSVRTSIERSVSWRLTQPARAFMRMVRGGPR